MHLWLLLAGVLILQEPISTTFVILEAIRAHYSPLLIHFLWLVLTIGQTYLGYVLGCWVRKRFPASPLEAWIARWTRRASDLIGKNGERVALVFFTILTMPVFTGFIGAWLPISLSNIMLFSVIGSLIWYITVWLGIYGADQFASNLETTVISVIVITIILSIPFAIWQKRKMDGFKGD